MPDLVIQPSVRPLFGSVPVPADKSITHRAILLAGIASGRSRIRGNTLGEDNRATLGALRALGVGVEEPTPGELLIEGKGLSGLTAPAAPIDCGNSGTTMRLLAGILAAQPFTTILVGDASLSKRPMERVAKPLRLRGARIEGRLDPRRVGEITAPLEIGPLRPPHALCGIEYDQPVASAQVKSALLLSGLYAPDATYVREPLVSRDHTERMLSALGVPIRTAGSMVELDPSGWSGEIPALDLEVPGDISAASFLLAAAQLVPESRVTVRRVGWNPTRTGIFEALRDMDGVFAMEAKGEVMAEPIGDLHASPATLRASRIGGEIAARSIDEIPILCALAARAHGVTEIYDAAELRVKESDRIAVMAEVLRAFGVRCEERRDGMLIEGRPDRPLDAAGVSSHGDHRIAMAAAVLALCADGPSRVRDAACIATSFPRFVGTLRALGATIEVDEGAP
ncbi:3-phosphoshikimate 1-carboxyvinyltransferase [Chondromyces apiculatus]|uniref:3-phosphoshikimate 1-carboxyvinyltransferase n=1 Tax=Chondromyces apiculatus DSM 436 TaxID=1192034 RepID=A0A017SZF3_9BACT|nr:3-phosphoshikimate 1-carboxyvinyltransferase [Chondromyces apiculatus]EYF01975.1 5-Enolpyruvylshikimate-3-phosphate synthase [Chondromyces apiculatus DSM 436]